MTTIRKFAESDLFSLDFDEITLGREFVTRGRTITEADLVGFATLTGDMHPVHIDAQWASESTFGERIAHGMLVLSYSIGLVPLSPERTVALRRVRDATFKAPARIGDTITVEGDVVGLQPLDNTIGQVSCQWRVLDQRRKTLVRATIEILWRRVPARVDRHTPGKSVSRAAEEDIAVNGQLPV